MYNTLKKLREGFVSFLGTTDEWKDFFKVFKKEFTAELKAIDAVNIVFSRGHFYISGFLQLMISLIIFQYQM